jgi:low temperature requirement protein LtrA
VRTDQAQGATFVELFFDLVFVFAITQLTGVVGRDLSWSGVGQAAIVFWLVWWAWTQFTWTLNLADTEQSLVRVPTLVATAVAFFLAQAVPDAMTTAGIWFAAAYVVVRLMGMGLQVWVIGEDEVQRSGLARYVSFSLLGVVLIFIGGFAAPDLRQWIWLAAIVADMVTIALAGRGSWVLEPGHFAERHGLIVIIALGESLIAAGAATAGLQRDAVFALTVTGAVVAACALWWVYFGSLQAKLERRLAAQDDVHRGRFARDVYSLWHAVMVAGVIGIAVGFEEAVKHPGDQLHTGSALALTLGVAIFLGGLAAATVRSEATAPIVPKLALSAMAIAATPLVTRVSGGVALWGVALATLAMIGIETRRS